jgi:hypothetical protein
MYTSPPSLLGSFLVKKKKKKPEKKRRKREGKPMERTKAQKGREQVGDI